jgi:cytochrome c-type biogenesis protein CcmH
MKRRSGAALLLTLTVLVGVAALAVVALRPRSEPAALQERVRVIGSTLRCPVCQDLSVADSPSGLARQMRSQIASRLRAGATPEQVKAEFVRSYGDWILLAPPKRGINLLVWLAPALVLLGGILAVGLALRKWTAGDRAEPMATAEASDGLAPADRRLLERAMAGSDEEPE